MFLTQRQGTAANRGRPRSQTARYHSQNTLYSRLELILEKVPIEKNHRVSIVCSACKYSVVCVEIPHLHVYNHKRQAHACRSQKSRDPHKMATRRLRCRDAQGRAYEPVNLTELVKWFIYTVSFVKAASYAGVSVLVCQ